ncbi:MAG: tryptophan synthase subunit alpha [Actinomycetia bacterium]|nr:tryptophan synthase subunit alpha [Actinomycetes bacterium]
MTDNGRLQLAEMFDEAQEQNRAVLLPYLTAGIPDFDTSVEIFAAMAAEGADGFEVGIPYTDPLMDGPVIMEAGEIAIRSGVTVDVALAVVAAVVTETGKPVLVMTYVNPVLRHGVDSFFAKVRAAGAAGVIIADLPADEAAPFSAAAETNHLGLVLFAAPTTDDDRLAGVIDADPAFVYAIAEVGVTGERTDASSNVAGLAERIRRFSDVPVVFGVGISTPDHVASAARHGDGVIVGSAIVRRVLEASSPSGAVMDVGAFVGGLVTATKRD